MKQTKISIRSYKKLQTILAENPRLKFLLTKNNDLKTIHKEIKEWVYELLGKKSVGILYYERKIEGRVAFRQLTWKEIAGIRILDYIENTGREIENANRKNTFLTIEPFKILWMAVNSGTGGGKFDFFTDMLALFRQFNGIDSHNLPSKKQVLQWMDRHPSGTENDAIAAFEINKKRIIKTLITKIKDSDEKESKYVFPPGLSDDEKIERVSHWWNDWNFHLKFAVRDPDTLNEMLDFSLSPQLMSVLHDAKTAGIPFFVNLYYLSLINVRKYAFDFAPDSDLALRDYIFYSRQLIDEFGEIEAWEKEDKVEPGKPNAAGWLLPSCNNMHRRYAEVAILIPDTVGRACGGLCVSCQRMYDFQSGHLNFDLNRLKPNESWPIRLRMLMNYFENDSKLRDILITGGDAFMSSDKSIQLILDAVYDMAVRKRIANLARPEGKKYAEMVRIRLGTRLPVYLPQRITPELCKILSEFKEKASKIGFKQFVIQTHFITPLEVTPEAIKSVKMLMEAGWLIANQMVFTTAASVRGHAAKLRKVLNDVGILSYYTFSVKGFRENSHNFATNARAIQELIEEKTIGTLPEMEHNKLNEFYINTRNLAPLINALRNKLNVPFLATDRTVMNIPGIGKSLTFRVIGITRFGNRILEFDNDATRNHSPIIEKMEKFTLVESKTMLQYMRQLERMGEDPEEYQQVYGYSLGETEPRMPIYEYPEYGFKTTKLYTNLEV